jgi:simple sugar transport system permease protein
VTQPAAPPADGSAPEPDVPAPAPGRGAGLKDVLLTTSLAFVLALLIGAVLIAVSDPDVTAAASYLFARPLDTAAAVWQSVSSAYLALFEGSVVNLRADTAEQMWRPLTETLTLAGPLIAAGLSVALAFKAGLFNIGANGQLIAGAILAAYVGFTWTGLPAGVHWLVATAAALLGGAIWGGIVGLLKARTGAHEVIVTIMMNFIALNLLAYLLRTSAFQRPGRNDPISPFVAPTATYPALLGEWSRLHLGFVLALLAALAVWWLLNRSVLGFRFRAVGANPQAARTFGISVSLQYFLVMALAGALAGLAGSLQVLGTEKALTLGIAGTIGFDAITVALLGRGSPLGTVLAGILFGGLRAGGVIMQARTGTPIDIVLVVQSLIVLFVAAPPLIRAVFRLTSVQGTSLQLSRGWG